MKINVQQKGGKAKGVGHFLCFGRLWVTSFWPGPSAEMCQGFLLCNFWSICRGFSWRIFLGTFPHKNEDKNPATKSAKKSGGSKIKIREKSVLPKPTLTVCHFLMFLVTFSPIPCCLPPFWGRVKEDSQDLKHVNNFYKGPPSKHIHTLCVHQFVPCGVSSDQIFWDTDFVNRRYGRLELTLRLGELIHELADWGFGRTIQHMYVLELLQSPSFRLFRVTLVAILPHPGVKGRKQKKAVQRTSGALTI